MSWINHLKEVFHGKGHEPYKSREAKLAFAESLLKMSDKLFFAPYLPIITLTFFESIGYVFWLQIIISGLMFISAASFRHGALIIIDELNPEKATSKNT